MFIKGYFYAAEEQAKAAVSACNAHYGIPVSPDATTQNWTSYTPINDGFVIMAHESLVVVLGEPTEIEIELKKE